MPLKTVHFSLRTWLVGFSLLTTLPLLVFALSVVWEYKDFQQQAMAMRLERRVDVLHQRVMQELNNAVGLLVALAESEATLSMDVPGLYAHAQRVVQRQPQIRAIALSDAQRIHFVSTAPLLSVDSAVNVPALVHEALITGVANVSGPFQSPVSPLTVVALTVPVVANGQATHVLRAILSVDTINRLLQDGQLPPGWVAEITDRQGLSVARSSDPERHVGHRVSDSVLQAARAGNGGAFESISVDGVASVSRLRPVFGQDWRLIVSVPKTLLHEPVTHMLWSVAGLAALWVGLSLLMAGLLSYHLTRQVGLVISAMQHGDTTLPPRAPVYVNELLEVFQRFGLVKQHELQAHGALDTALAQRDEIQDLYDQAPCGYHSLDPQGRVVRMNQTELDWLGLSHADVMGRPYLDFVTESSKEVFAKSFPQFLKQGYIKDLAFDLVCSSGGTLPVLISATAMRDADGRILASRSTVFDITAQRRYEAELARLANTDALTGLSNRREFQTRAEQEIARCQRLGGVLYVMGIDIDFFKRVNDQHGHAAGDEVLREFGRKVRSLVRTVDTPARMGGEEFAVLVPQAVPNDADIAKLAERLRAVLAASPVEWDGQRIGFTVSIGVALWRPGETMEGTLARADQALYDAKNAGRNRVCFRAGG